MSLQDWLARYGESHQHPINILIHKICVPTIVFTVFGLFWMLPVPDAIRSSISMGGVGYGNLATVVFLLGLGFYLRLSRPMAVGMALMCIANLALLGWLQLAGVDILQLSIVIFVLAWIGQFIGHAIEGKKPSFLQDLQFLLIAPAWTLAPLYRALHIRF
ncbi:putative membrane protein YGL010W [Chitinivorax tropicus]|uniref:Putative membrane protein YGL010W n=2 Tax=Chitinivorax tropicus TaxID=714531 RepID=A0A840MLF7_9PROT|nr:Mpo1-like protein [Chitinivorax tropicus]MBB5017969.1 putative membrane protein YGL010W [Chitinivorax tropicus]